MNRYPYILSALGLFVVSSGFFYWIKFSEGEINTIFLTISTFLFAIFTGFFISRQGERYTAIRDKITTFDGIITSVYRHFELFAPEFQSDIKKIIIAYYRSVDSGAWDFTFTRKASILVDTQNVVKSVIAKNKLSSPVQSIVLERILTVLEEAQQIRKNVIALKGERISRSQWIVVFILTVILLMVISVEIPSYLMWMNAILKGAFLTSVLFIVVLLRQLDHLKLFEETIGEKSAQDVLDIVEGKV